MLLSMQVDILHTLSDNYAYLLRGNNDDVAVVDPGDAVPILEALKEQHIALTHILITHHHHDHIAGISKLLEEFPNLETIGPKAERDKIPALTKTVCEMEAFDILGTKIQVIETPGHTLGSICFYLPEHNILFSGDTLFSMGCGRLFEGTPEHMFASFEKLKTLPDETMIYCGHEYTRSNAEFCLSIEPENQDLQTRYNEVKSLGAANMPTIPVSLKTEKNTNVFLRAPDAKTFAHLRKQKDQA